MTQDFINETELQAEERQMFQPQTKFTPPYQTGGFPTPGYQTTGPMSGMQTPGAMGGYQTAGHPMSGFPTTGHPQVGFPSPGAGFPSGGFPAGGFPPAGMPMQGFPQLPTEFPQQVMIPTPAGAPLATPGATPFTGQMAPTQPGLLPLEQSYIENILRLNLGRPVRVFMTYENNPEWNARVYTGILDEAGRDHIILRDEEAGKSYLLLMVNLDWVEIEGRFNYHSPSLPGFAPAGVPIR